MDSQPLQTYESVNLAHLRDESLRSIAILNSVIGYVWLVVILTPTRTELLLTETWRGSLILVLTSLIAIAAHRRSFLASALLVSGSLFAILSLILVYRSVHFYYFLLIPLIYIGVLFNHPAVPAFTILANLLIIWLHTWYLDLGPILPDLILPILFISIAALASWFSAKNLVVALTWVWSQYQRSMEMERVAQERGAELRQALKSLDEATYRLERTNQMLALAYRQAEEARRLKQEFAQTISHELRTPINLIVGFTEVLAQNPEYYGSRLTPAYMRDLSIVHRNACHLQGLVNDVLDLARIDAAQMGVVFQEVDPGELIIEAVNTARGLVEARGLELALD
jgi:signal transduction histidine kinase